MRYRRTHLLKKNIHDNNMYNLPNTLVLVDKTAIPVSPCVGRKDVLLLV